MKTCRDCSGMIKRHRKVCDSCLLKVRQANGRRSQGKNLGRGRPKSEETRRRMSVYALAHREEMARRASGPKSPAWRLAQAERARLGISGFRLSKRQAFLDQRGRTFRMRSIWEVLLAKWLDSRGYLWDYEPLAISLLDGSAYLPDFRLEDGRFLEVKGYAEPAGMRKVALARGMGYRIIVLSGRALRRLGVLGLRRSNSWEKADAGYTTSRRTRLTSM